PFNPTGLSVALAFILYPRYGDPPNPGSGDWNAASWETDTSGLLTTYWAQCEVGPGGVVLAAGRYRIAVQVNSIIEFWGWDLVIT
ncbi:MAG: hypothetical protein KGJ86_15620, partial [Chloroflexota bacterium]|nr:hypothetical protein [Chloroflexota bacterium]